MVTTEEVARLFLHYIWKLYELPQYIILDHRAQFVALFTKECYESPKKGIVSQAFEHLIKNLKIYNRVEI